MIESSPGPSHMPRSIFPEVPAARRYSTINGGPSTSTGISPRQGAQRRHTTYLAPAPGPGTRREPRPLRSSPLAGPSLALSHDGTLTGPDERSNPKLRVRPNRISSTPDVSTATLMKLEGRSVATAPSSPTGSYRGGAPLPLVAQDTADNAIQTPAPPSPVKQSAARRLSLGFKRLSALPGLPHKAAIPDTNDAASVKPASRGRSSSLSSSGHQDEQNVPPVPSIPVWARPSFMPSSPRSSPTTVTFAREHESRPSLARRPSTAPSTSSRSSRHSSQSSHHPHAQFPHAAPPQPSTSRNPELNWMSAAAAPKFSRLGLKAEGVVLPVSAKEARRRSTIRVPPEAASVKSVKSQSSLRSVSKSLQSLPDTIVPPTPPFRREASVSSSSLASSTGSLADSDTPATPSLSRASSESGASEHEVSTPPAVDELGVVHHGLDSAQTKGKEMRSPGVELRVNDVMVEIIELKERRDREAAADLRASDLKIDVEVVKTGKTGAPERKGTLKRVWRKVVGSMRG